MSIRIYKGFLIDTDSVSDIALAIEEFRPWVRTAAEAKLDKFVKSLSATKDNREAYRTWQARREASRATNYRDPAVDTDFSLAFIAHPNQMQCLGICYTENLPWFRKWLKTRGVQEYSYWNNADKPSRLSAREWAERGIVWGSVPLSDPASTYAMHIDLIGPGQPLPRAARSLKGKTE